MANKRITDVDYINSLTDDASFFINHSNSIKQVNKSNVTFDIANGGTGATTAAGARTNLGLGSVSTEDTVPISKGGTGATTASGALANLGITATASELNVMDGIAASTTELNYCSGATSNIQTQLNNKASSSHMHTAAEVGAAVANHTHTADEIGAKSSGAVEPMTTGGTGASNGADGLKNLFSAGYTILSSKQYGENFPDETDTSYVHKAGTIFLKKV